MATDALTCADVKDMLLKESKNVTEVAPSSMTRFKPSSDLALRAQPRLIVVFTLEHVKEMFMVEPTCSSRVYEIYALQEQGIAISSFNHIPGIDLKTHPDVISDTSITETNAARITHSEPNISVH